MQTKPKSRAQRFALIKKLSRLIVIAVDDAETVEKMPGYVLDMNTWHEPTFKPLTRQVQRCCVCMAGACMVRQLKVPKGVDASPYLMMAKSKESERIQTKVVQRLFAINMVRSGDILDAWRRIVDFDYIELIPKLTLKQQRAINAASQLINNRFSLSVNRADWDIYRKAADVLRQAGL